MTWHVKVDDYSLDSDDLLIGEIEAIEKESGNTPWSILNPLKEVRIAKAFLRVMYRKEGLKPPEINKAIDALTLKQLKTAFDWVPDADADPLEAEEDESPSPGEAETSSPTEPDDSTGSPPKRGSKP